jgi:hypothetical protein
MIGVLIVEKITIAPPRIGLEAALQCGFQCPSISWKVGYDSVKLF